MKNYPLILTKPKKFFENKKNWIKKLTIAKGIDQINKRVPRCFFSQINMATVGFLEVCGSFQRKEKRKVFGGWYLFQKPKWSNFPFTFACFSQWWMVEKWKLIWLVVGVGNPMIKFSNYIVWPIFNLGMFPLALTGSSNKKCSKRIEKMTSIGSFSWRRW